MPWQVTHGGGFLNLRVAYLCEFGTLLGGERSLLTFLDHARQAGLEPLVVAPRGGLLARELEVRGIERLDWPPGGRRESTPLAPALRSRGVSLIHSNSLMVADASKDLSVELGIPGLTHIRDIMSLSEARRNRLGELAALITVSEAVQSWLVQSGIPGEKIVKIHNAVDKSALRRAARPGDFRRELGLSRQVPLVACIGQIALRKGQDLFLAAAARVTENHPEAHFLLAGTRYSRKAESQEYEARLYALAAEPSLSGKVHLLGYREDIPSILSDSDVVVVPSRQEPFSRVLLESLALGIPAVATTVGGTREIITQDATGILVPPDDPVSMAKAIGRLLSQPDLRARLRAAGVGRAEDFSPQRQVAAISALYERILAADSC